MTANANEVIAKAIVENGAEAIDWDAVKAMVEAGTKTEEEEALDLEGLASMPEDLVPLRTEKLLLDQQLDNLQARKKEIQDEFGKRLKADGLVGYVLNGKVHARRSQRTRTDVDRKRLKEELPHIYKNYLKVTSYIAVNIT